MSLDPHLFTEEAVDPEVARFVANLESSIAALPKPAERDAVAMRAARAKGQSVFGKRPMSTRARKRSIPGPSGDIAIRVIEPADSPQAVMLHIHGGGFVLGDAADQDDRLERIVDEHNLATVSVDYRLAPEHPYPAAPDDCETAARWLADNATATFGTDTLLIAGESAGAHLAVVTLLRLRDRHDFTGFAGANLLYGVFDIGLTPSARNWGSRDLVLSTPTVEWFNQQFAGAADVSDPDVSPIHADLAGLPPALFTIGTYDPLLDDSLFMSARWAAAGSPAELAVYPGAVHAFDYFDTDQAKLSHGRVADFIESVVAGSA